MQRDTRNYWQRLRHSNYSRRSVLRGSGATAAGMAGLALVGCGNDDDDGNGNGNGNGSPQPTATSANGNGNGNGASPTPSGSGSGTPVRGGTWRMAIGGDPGTIDPYQGTALPTHQTTGFVYSRLYRFEAGPGVDPAAYVTEPDLAASMPEITDDGLTYIVKLNPEAKWHAPIDRPLDAEDVVFSWDRWRGALDSFPGNPSAEVVQGWLEGVEAIDDETIQITLHAPRGSFLVSENKWQVIMPREADGGYDPNQEMIGTGPWLFEAYEPGQFVRYRRNPEWHLGPDAPYFDEAEVAVIPDYTARLTQFLAGEVDEMRNIDGIDLSRAGDQYPDLQLFIGMAELPNSVLTFPEAQTTDQPWGDPRVRKAVSMCLERDQMLDAAYNLEEIEAAGYDVVRRWNNDTASFDTAHWLDPKGEYVHQDGDPVITDANKASFEYNPGAAQELLAEAGYEDGFSAPLYTTSSQYGPNFNVLSELIQAFTAEAGIDLQYEDVDYNSVYITQIVIEKNFDGALHIPKRTGVRSNLESYYLPGFIANYPSVNDEKLIEDIESILTDADPESARIKVLELQNYTNDQMYFIPMQLGAAGGYTAYQPGLHNVLDYQVIGQDFGNETVPFYWREA